MENGQLTMENEPLPLGDVGAAYQFAALSFPRSAWKCCLGCSCGLNPYATLERRRLLPRWSVGAREARRKLVRSLLTNCISLAFPRRHQGARDCDHEGPKPGRVRYADHSPVGFARGSVRTADSTRLEQRAQTYTAIDATLSHLLRLLEPGQTLREAIQ